MKKSSVHIVLAVLLGMVLAKIGFARGGDADLPDEVRALIKREQAKALVQDTPDKRVRQNPGNRGGNRGNGSASAGCNLDIGNVNTGGRGTGPRQVTTIITGPVIQTNNKCN